MTASTDGATMAKVQKTFLIPEELAAIIDKIIERSGSNFTKIATAALLQYLFDHCEHPEDHGPIVCPASQWMSRVLEIERGKYNVADIPLRVLEESVYSAKVFLEPPGGPGAEWKPGAEDWAKKVLPSRKEALRDWKNAVKEGDGAMAAILQHVDEFYDMAGAK